LGSTSGGVVWDYYDDYDTEPSITYYYWARGANYNGTSDFSDSDTGWVGITGAPDLVIDSVSHSPQNPTLGSDVTFTVTVKNLGSGDLGTGDASKFNVGFWSNLSTNPDINDTPDMNKDISSLEAGDSNTLQFVVTAQSEGEKLAWVYADRYFNNSEIDESNETNNVGPTSGYSWSVAKTPDIPDDPPPSDSPGDGGGCFIATAAYGSYLDLHVKVLRDFRDKYLQTNVPGKIFVELYYKYSPPIAEYIKDHESLRTITRWTLTPIVYGVKYPKGSLIIVISMGIAFVELKRVRGRNKTQISK